MFAGKEGSEQAYIMPIQVDFGHKLTKFDNCPCKASTFLLRVGTMNALCLKRFFFLKYDSFLNIEFVLLSLHFKMTFICYVFSVNIPFF